MSSCIFCKIVKKEMPAKIVYEDDFTIAFDDINPIAPIHLLIIPKKHIGSLVELDSKTNNNILNTIKKLVEKFNLSDKGYRITVNGGIAQEVPHVHFHLVAPAATPQ